MPLPKFIVCDNKLSTNSKFLYGLLLNRTLLSQKNSWTDENNNVFIYYPVNEMAAHLGRSVRTAQSALRELDDAGLIRRVHQGWNRPNLIYVLLPDTEKILQPECAENCSLTPQETANADGQKLRTSNTKEHKDPSIIKRVSSRTYGHYQNVFLTDEELADLQASFPAVWEQY